MGILEGEYLENSEIEMLVSVDKCSGHRIVRITKLPSRRSYAINFIGLRFKRDFDSTLRTALSAILIDCCGSQR